MLIDPTPMLLRPAFDLSISMWAVLELNIYFVLFRKQMAGLFETLSATLG